MKKHFILSGIAATIVNLVVVGGIHFLFLKDIMEAHPPVSAEFHKQLVRPTDQLIGWAMAMSALTMGFFITTVINWSGARTFVSGLQKGFIIGFLFWSSVNFGLFSSSNQFSLFGVFVDLPCSILAMTLAAAFAAWVLGKGKK